MLRYRYRFFVFLMMLLSAVVTFAETAELDAGSILFIQDPSLSMGIRQIMDLPEENWNVPEGKLYFGYTKNYIWLKIPVESDKTSQLFLTEHNGIDQFDVWIVNDQSQDPEFLGSSGWAVFGVSSELPVLQGFSSIPLHLEKNRRQILFVRVQSTSSLALNFQLMDMDDYQYAYRATTLIQGVGIGSSLMFMIFSMFIMISFRRREFFEYFFLVLVTFLIGLYAGGFGPLILWNSHPAFTLLVGVTAFPLLIIASLRFFRSVLEFESFQRFRLWLKFSEYALYFFLILVLILPRSMAFHLSSYFSLFMVLYLHILLFSGVLLGIRYSGYLLISWSVTLVAGLIQMMVNIGWLPFVPYVYSTGFLTMFAFLIQNAILSGTIMVQSEASIMDERLRRIDAEHQVKDARERLIQSDRMNGLASMVSSVAHEMGTPIGNARLLGSEVENKSKSLEKQFSMGELSKEAFEDYLHFSEESGALIVQTLSHAGDIMEGFKVVAADKAILKNKTIEPGEYFGRMERILAPRVRRSGHEFKVMINAKEPLETVPGYVTQVVDNLINNAIKHAFPGDNRGCIELEVQKGRNKGLEISVIDNGEGISEEILPNIFEMFFTTREEDGGTGLGLAISKTLAEESLKGSLRYYPGENGGSRFVLEIADLSIIDS